MSDPVKMDKVKESHHVSFLILLLTQTLINFLTLTSNVQFRLNHFSFTLFFSAAIITH